MQISIILPDTKAIPETILSLLKDTDYYQISNLPLTEITKKPFIEAFIKKGKLLKIFVMFRKISNKFFCFSGQFYGISANTRIDVDNCVCITPTGICYLSVNKDTYHRLGIEGKVSSFAKKHRNRYGKLKKKLRNIKIDLN